MLISDKLKMAQKALAATFALEANWLIREKSLQNGLDICDAMLAICANEKAIIQERIDALEAQLLAARKAED